MSGRQLTGYPCMFDGKVMVGPRQFLSERQEQIWRGIAASETTEAIADNMGLSPKTVEYHRLKLKQALKVWDVAGLTRAAIRVGLIEP